jgi:heat shock protein HslJ
MKIPQLIAALFLLILSSSCSIMNQKADYVNLGESQWTLMSIQGSPISLGGDAVLSFDEKESTISGVAACNSFTAEYEMMRKAVKFLSIVSTKKYCEGRMDEENKIISNLQLVTRYDVKANMLYLYSQDQLLLTYKR